MFFKNSSPFRANSCGNGRYAYLYSNHRGDTTSLLKHDGQSLHSYLYDEFGLQYDVNKHATDASDFTDPHAHYTFSAKQFDEETELSYFGARSYDAWNGTWTKQDLYRGQIDLPETLHRYQFNKNNAINYIDPDGFIAMKIKSGRTFNIPKLGTIDLNSGLEIEYEKGVLHLGVDVTGSLLTENHSYSGSASGDVVAGYNKEEGVVGAIGGGISVAKDGKVVYEKIGSAGNAAGYKHLGVSNAREYSIQKQKELHENIVQSVNKLKTERTRRELELARQQELASLYGPQAQEPEDDYLDRSWNQLIKGNFTEDVTLMGTTAQIGTGLIGVDLPGDIRDIIADLSTWEWTWGHAGQTGLDLIGV